MSVGPKADGARVLLVEDHPMNRDMLSRRLRRRGYVVFEAPDATVGLAIAASGSIDLILMDLSLPDIDGWSATRQLKANEKTRAIPVVALTAHAMAGDRESALAAGCDAFETKPVDLPQLLQTIEGLLRSHPGGRG